MNHDIRPSMRRSWRERHPVMSEWIAMLCVQALVGLVAYWILTHS